MAPLPSEPNILFRQIRAVARVLHELEVLRREEALLSVLIAGRRAAGNQWEDLLDMQARSRRRTAKLLGNPFAQAALAGRRLLHAMPPILREPIRSLARRAATDAKIVDPATPSSDLAAAVPFGPGFPGPSLALPVAVIAHIFYPELAPLLCAYMARIPGEVDVYISTDTPAKAEQIRQAFSGWTAGGVEIRLAPNRGRDVAPKLITFRDLYDRYEIVLFLHSKRSPHDSDLALWRDFLLETLLGDEGTARSVLAAFEQRRDLGIVAPQHYFAVRNGITWGENRDSGLALASRMGLSLHPAAPLDFSAGSMFWARTAALRPLLGLELSIESFEPEVGQVDGTRAHALERLYFHACEHVGYRWLKIGRLDLVDASPAPPWPVRDPADLTALMDAVPTLQASGQRR
jgi:hypothetical protein